MFSLVVCVSVVFVCDLAWFGLVFGFDRFVGAFCAGVGCGLVILMLFCGL